MSDQRNFLLIFADQWRGDCLSALGHPVVETPNLDDLARKGVTFARAYSPSPSCIPARACLATGQTPWNCGRIGYKDRVPWTYRQTMMSTLRDAGYQTINVGKTHFFPQRANVGFEVNHVYDPQRLSPGFESDYHAWLAHETNGAVEDPALIIDNNSWMVAPWDAPSYLHPTEWTASTAVEALKRRDPMRPFFMQVGFHRPHPPYDPPTYYQDRYEKKPLPQIPLGDWLEGNPVHANENARTDAFHADLPKHLTDRTRRAYFAAIAHIDAQLSRILFWLANNGLMENTTIIFSSDHGELLGDHHMYRKANPWEGSASVPLIIKPAAGIDVTPGHVDRDTAVSLIDIMPTLLGHAGVAVPEAVDGMDITPWFTAGQPAPGRAYIHGEHAAVDGNGWQYTADGRYKYIWETKAGREWLFDLQEDPQEVRDLSKDAGSAQVLERHRGYLVEALRGRGDGLTDGEKLLPGRLLPQTVAEVERV